jgi:superfamily I DNA/RNA helicase
LPFDFLLDEVEYVMGRFLPNDFNKYLTARRDGRGLVPRVERPLRKQILDNVIIPYQEYKRSREIVDWNDLAVSLSEVRMAEPYDIILADETQDFSANQIRAINNHLASTHSLTLIIDTAQRIYPRGFAWQEVGIIVRPENSHRLSRNYRNTIEIAKLAVPLLIGLPLDDDATMPDFSKCELNGRLPIILKGRYSNQAEFVINYIRSDINLDRESVAILHPLGGGWFKYMRDTLFHEGLPYVEITRESEWPKGDENIAICTLSSSKGLEFDHVIIIGLNEEVMPHSGDEDDEQLIKLRRLLAMGISRARKTVILGSKADDPSRLLSYLDPSTYEEIIL